jgi:signal recognition particle subunit SRP54
LELFHPDRLASRILGMGDMLSLIEDVERNMDKEKAEKLAKKIHKGKAFNLEDYRDQLTQLKSMGGVMAMLDKLPGVATMPQHVKYKIDEKELFQQLAMIDSMTKKERQTPDILNASRKNRIAKGSGTDVQDINKMLKQFEQMQKIMKKFKKGSNLMGMMRGAKAALGRRAPVM